MWSCTHLLLLLWISLAIPDIKCTPCQERKEYFVSSNGTDAEECIKNPSRVSCKSLHYLNEQNITKCVNITILNSMTLTRPLVFSSSSDLLIMGGHTKSVCVECENGSGLLFTLSQNVKIVNISFVGCSAPVDGLEENSSAPNLLTSLAFSGGVDVQVILCSFSNFSGSALLFSDVDGVRVMNSTFIGNPESRTSGVVIRQKNLTCIFRSFNYTIQNCTFMHLLNPAFKECPDDSKAAVSGIASYTGFGGGIDTKILAQNSMTTITITGSTFIDNRALYGGAVCMSFSGKNSSNVLHIVNSLFESNVACTQGGAVSVRTDEDLEHHQESSLGSLVVEYSNFTNNRAFWGGGISLYRCSQCGNISFKANHSIWRANNAFTSGFGVAIGGNHTSTKPGNIYAIDKFFATATFIGCRFSSNTNNQHYQNIDAVGALQVTACDVTLNGTMLFDSNYGTALLLKTLSRATFSGNVTFVDNFGINGGAILVIEGSHIVMHSACNVTFVQNRALVIGGAVHSKKIFQTHGNPPVPCLFNFDEGDSSDFNGNVTFMNNVASHLNQSIFIGNPRHCNLFTILSNFNFTPNIDSQVQTVAANISFDSIPKRNGTKHLKIMLGETLYLKPSVRDEFQHPSTTFGYVILLSADHTESTDFTLVGPNLITLDNFTQNVPFHIKGVNKTSETDLIIEFLFEQIWTYRSGNAEFQVQIVDCKLGYKYSPNSQICECVSSTKDGNIICPLADRAIFCIKQGYWFDRDKQLAIPCKSESCEYANGKCPPSASDCPTSPGYCSIQDPDDICWDGRGKYLCSQCRNGCAFNFGAFRCVPNDTCHTKNTVLILLSIFGYWVLMLAVMLSILSLKLSIGSGFMYGLVYYFSVISLFTDDTIQAVFLRTAIDTSISLTQLDPRVIINFMPICFLKGMDIGLYHLILHYVTPVFFNITILLIVALSRTRFCCLPKCISLAENSPIHAICMLILFSYTSLSYTNIQILRPIEISGEMYVYKSPEIRYFDPKHHLPWALLAITIEFVICMPVCILLLFAPWISKKVDLVKLRLKPIVDEFQACYRPECRWFAGFYFLARQLMYITNLIPQQDLTQSNTLLLCLSVLILLIHTSVQPYHLRWLNILDSLFLVNLVLFSVYVTAFLNPTNYSSLNLLFYNGTPYVLTLVPVGYLLGVVILLLLTRFYLLVKRTRFYTFLKHRVFAFAPNDNLPTRSTVAMNSRDSDDSLKSQSVFRDEGEREPLLADYQKETPSNSKTSKTRPPSTTSLFPFPPLQ